jgi:carboxyl-terminal processing protease
VKVELDDLSRLSAMLLTKNLIFNYATEFSSKNSTISKPEEFKLSDSQYEEFKNFALKDEFSYTTASEEALKKMKETAEKEGYFNEVKSEYEAMMAKVTPSKSRDLDKFKEEISQMLENEIVSRYYYQKGRTVNSFRYDNVLLKAKYILGNSNEYNTILKK